MGDTIRYPFAKTNPKVGPSELPQIITLLSAVNLLAQGGQANFVSILPWKLDVANTESPFTCVVIEISSASAQVIGNGTTDQVGIFGEIADPTGSTPAVPARFLLGVLGISRGNALVQIPLITRADATVTGYAQVVANIAAFDAISVGSVSGDIVVVGVTAVARPIRRRSYAG